MIRLSLGSVGLVEDTGSVIIVLRAEELGRLLVMEVGLLEGRAIAMEAEGVRAPRPLTHDLLYQVVQSLGAQIASVRIRDYKDSTFFAHLYLQQADGREIEVDARPSDAIAIALRSGAPIYATDDVMEAAGLSEEMAEEDETIDDTPEGEEEEDGEDPIVH
ncbi:MAG TPA: bifunctional nuclease family protein [Symbiobacteriaceae bacterium]|nr:bifunctional nuclease family protein [Symbiobacteriaceae bacterium]